MAKEKKVIEKINYSGDDAYLWDCMLDRGLYPPVGSDGQLHRKFAVQRLQEWESKHAAEQRKVKVRFSRSSDKSSGNYVYAAINEKNWQIPYDVDVILPEYVLTECINRAVTKKVKNTQVLDESTGTVRNRTEESETQVYPYFLYGYVSEEDDTAIEIKEVSK